MAVRVLFFVFISLMIAVTTARAESDPESHPQIAKDHPLPYLALHSVNDSKAVSFDSFRGKKLIVLHFAASDSETTDNFALWIEFAAKIEASGDATVVGVIHELHRDRAKLFCDWKKLTFPVFHDPLNSIAVPAVPRALGVDAEGITRTLSDSPEKALQRFVKKKFTSDHTERRSANTKLPTPKTTKRTAEESRRAISYINHGDALVFSGTGIELTEAIDAYRQAFRKSGTADAKAAALFRMGTAYYLRSESDYQQADDFQLAVSAWTKAAQLVPSNEIYQSRAEKYVMRSAGTAPLAWISQSKRDATLKPRPLPVECFYPALDRKAPSPPPSLTENTELSVEELLVVEPCRPTDGGASTILARIPALAEANPQDKIQFWIESANDNLIEPEYMELVNDESKVFCRAPWTMFQIQKCEPSDKPVCTVTISYQTNTGEKKIAKATITIRSIAQLSL